MTIATPWLATFQRKPHALLRLVCAPFGGGSAAIYRGWQDALPAWVEICPVQLPGRGSRSSEQPYCRLLPLVADLARELGPHLDRPYALFGHSLGALICFELARQLRRQGLPRAQHLFASGCPGPRSFPSVLRHRQTDEQLIDDLHNWGAVPSELLTNAEFMDWYLPVFRADCEVYETYHYTPGRPLSCSISAYRGVDDVEVGAEGLAAWREETSGGFSSRVFPGGHLFLHSHRIALLRELNSQLSPLQRALESPPPSEN